jgi:quercetin dioxygenase-like cupin family protein
MFVRRRPAMASAAQVRHHADVEPIEMMPRVLRRTLACGERAMLCEFTSPKGATVPPHRHVHEQLGYVVSGRVALTIEQADHVVGPGDGYSIPSNALHSAEVLEDAVVIEVFSPIREDYK